MNRAYVAVASIVGLFVLVQVGALALVQPFMDAGLQTVEDPSDPANSLLYVGAILVATVLMLVAMKYGVDRILQGLVLFAAVFLSFYVFAVVLPDVATVGGVNLPAAALALLLGAGLLAYPEWYVIDAAGVVMGAGAAGLFGISFGLLPALLLLVVLAVYDAISVYGTEHMLTLASGALDLRLPVVFVVPLTLSYSFLEEGGPDTIGDDATGAANETGETDGTGGTEADDGSDDGGPDLADAHGSTDPTDVDGGPDTTGDAADAAESDERPLDDEAGRSEDAPDPFARDAFFIGLGDAVIPAVLVASAAFFRPGGAGVLDVPGIALTVPALGAMLGTVAGLLALMTMVMKGRAHAGLPLLNGGAIGGYLLGALLVGVAPAEAVGVAPYL